MRPICLCAPQSLAPAWHNLVFGACTCEDTEPSLGGIHAPLKGKGLGRCHRHCQLQQIRPKGPDVRVEWNMLAGIGCSNKQTLQWAMGQTQ